MSERKKLSWFGLIIVGLFSASVYAAAVIYLSVPYLGLRFLAVKVPFILFLAFTVFILLNYLHYRYLKRFRFVPYLTWLLIFIPAARLFISHEPNEFQFIIPYQEINVIPGSPASAWTQTKLMLNQDVRWGKPLFSGAPLKINLDVPKHAYLSFAAGVLRGEDPPRETRLSLSIETAIEPPREIINWDLPADRHAWHDMVVDLTPFAGERAVLTLENLSEPSDESDLPLYLFLTEPRVIIQPPDQPRPNVIIVVVDALRYDAVSQDPNEGDTPLLYYRAQQNGVKFKRHYAQSSWTAPSVASLLTSKMPIQTGVISKKNFRFHMLNSGQTIMDKAREAGYLTAGFSANRVIHGLYNFDQGMDRLVARGETGWWDSAQLLTEEALNWIELHKGLPFVVYMHYMDPHAPYIPPGGHTLSVLWDKGLFKILKSINLRNPAHFKFDPRSVDIYYAFYRAEVRYWDQVFNDFMDQLDEKGLLDHTLVIVTADHGEEFLEHQNLGHGHGLYQEVIHVPMIIFPGGTTEPKTIDQLTRNLDLAPTVAEFLGIAPSPEFLGQSLMPFIKGGNYAGLPQVAAVSELPIAGPLPPNSPSEYFRYWRAYVKGHSKLIEKGPDENTVTYRELYLLNIDPMEEIPLPLDRAPNSSELISELHRYFEGLPDKQEVPETEEEPGEVSVQMLKDLGYIQ